jgi:hypothetical protein
MNWQNVLSIIYYHIVGNELHIIENECHTGEERQASLVCDTPSNILNSEIFIHSGPVVYNSRYDACTVKKSDVTVPTVRRGVETTIPSL